MKFIKSIEDKIKINIGISIACIISSLLLSIYSIYKSYKVIDEANNRIYVLSDNTPLLALKTDFSVNREVEYKSQIDLFHSLFFNLSPDNNFIENQIKKSMYLIDESGMHQYRNMKEKGWFSSIISSNSIVNLYTDSINVDIVNKSFTFYGKQIIERKTSKLTRTLITTGIFEDVPRTENNSHGVMLKNWKTIENKDLLFEEKVR